MISSSARKRTLAAVPVSSLPSSHPLGKSIMNSAITLSSAPKMSPRATRAHAMKNCMSVVIAISRLVERELSGESRVRIGRLQAAMWRLRDLIDEDLRAEAGAVSVAPRALPSCVATLVEKTTADVADRAADARVEVFAQCGGGHLVCDEGALREALFNLLANAIEASPGGAVFLATYMTTDGDQYWVLRDTGGGMPANEMAELGRPFRTTKAGGSGIGLALARAAVAEHGGLLSNRVRGRRRHDGFDMAAFVPPNRVVP